MKIELAEIKSFFFHNKTLKQTIFKNSFWLILSQVITRVISFFVVVWPTRHFGPSVYGEFVFALSFVSIFCVLTDFGMTGLVMREVARDKEKIGQYIDNVLLIKVILSVFFSAIIFISVYFAKVDQETVKLIYVLGLYIIVSGVVSFFESIFMASEKAQYATVCAFFGDIFLLLLVCIFIFGRYQIVTLGYAYLVSAALEGLLAMTFVWYYFSKFFLRINFQFCKKIIKNAWPFGLAAFFSSVYYYSTPVLLGILRTSSEVGWYNAAFKLAFFITSLSSIVFLAFFPLISRSFKEGANKFKESYDKYADVVFAIAVPLGFGGLIVTPEIINFLYGKPYYNSILPFQIMVWGASFNFLGSLYCNCLLACDEQKESSKVWAVAILFNIILNLILIPRYGVMGAAISVPLTEMTVFILAYLKLKKIIKPNFLKFLIWPLLASLVMSAFLLIIKKLGILNPIFLIIFGAMIYFSVLYLFYKIRRSNLYLGISHL